MADLLQHDLDPYSRLAVRLVLERFPDWEPFAAVKAGADGSSGAVEFNVPCANPAVEYGFWVWTDGEELTVGFHTHHTHFTDYDDRSHVRQIAAGLDYAADILAERIGVLSWYRGGAFAGSVSAELPHPNPLHELLADGGVMARAFAGCERVTLRSWTGRFDREELVG